MPAQLQGGSSTPDDARDNEGGRFAIAGLVYQTIGVAGLLSEAQLRIAPDKMRGTLAITHEKYGQDAVLDRELIQFKFSLGRARPIQPKELYEEIVDSLVKSERVAANVGGLPCKFRLVTNRPLSPAANREVEAAKSGASTRYLKGNDDRRRILASLRREQKTLAELKGVVEEYGRRRGMFPAELNDGVQKLIGWLMENTGVLGPLRVTREDLDERLVGSREVSEIRPVALREPMSEELQRFRRDARLPDRLVRRDILSRLQRSLQEYPIVVVHGRGGTGKTAVLEETLREFLESLPPKGYAAGEFADRLAHPWIGQLVQRWRDIPSAHTESSQTGLDRLRQAQDHKDQSWFLLGLDGIDETPRLDTTNQNQVEEILNLAAHPHACGTQDPIAIRVVVTCRTVDELKRRWRGYEANRQDRLIDDIATGDFATAGRWGDELQLAADLLSSDVSKRIRAALPNVHSNAAALRSATPKPVKVDILASLRHPLVWGCFVERAEANQDAILSGQECAVSELASDYVGRFADKAAYRRAELSDRGRLQNLLEVVACATNLEQAFAYRDYWYETVRASHDFEDREIREAYLEAVSFGVISERSGQDPNCRQWFWQHAFVWRYLGRRVHS
jgi:hypothetical protein